MCYDSVIFDNDGVLLTLTDMDAHVGARQAFEAGRGLAVDSPRRGDEHRCDSARSSPKVSQYDIDPEKFFRTRDRP